MTDIKAKILIAGGSGYIGQALTRFFVAQGKEVHILTRQKKTDTEHIKWLQWDGKSLADWKAGLENTQVIINLTGHSIACVHNQQNQKKIIESRINSVRVLDLAMKDLESPPPVWIQASAVGYYGDSGDDICLENSPAGSNFLADVCDRWEQEFDSAKYSGRKVAMRLGSVIGKEAQMIKKIEPVVKFFLGGAAGSGKQYMSWVHIADIVNVVDWILNNNEVSGVYNVVAPQALTNAEFMKELRRKFNRPWVPAAPKFIIKIVSRYLMGVDSSLVLEGNRASAQKLQDKGFQFTYPSLSSALGEIYG